MSETASHGYGVPTEGSGPEDEQHESRDKNRRFTVDIKLEVS